MTKKNYKADNSFGNKIKASHLSDDNCQSKNDKDSKYGKYPSIEPELELNSISMYECTGLIPAGITDESQIEEYEKIYPYIAPTTLTEE